MCVSVSSPATVPEVKVSEQTPSDELARKMRHYSGRSEYIAGASLNMDTFLSCFCKCMHNKELDKIQNQSAAESTRARIAAAHIILIIVIMRSFAVVIEV